MREKGSEGVGGGGVRLMLFRTWRKSLLCSVSCRLLLALQHFFFCLQRSAASPSAVQRTEQQQQRRQDEQRCPTNNPCRHRTPAPSKKRWRWGTSFLSVLNPQKLFVRYYFSAQMEFFFLLLLLTSAGVHGCSAGSAASSLSCLLLQRSGQVNKRKNSTPLLYLEIFATFFTFSSALCTCEPPCIWLDSSSCRFYSQFKP